MDEADKYLNDLLRLGQLDLGALSRERLEELFIGLLRGQVVMYRAVGEETRSSEVIGALRGIVEGLQLQLSQANEALRMATTALARLDRKEAQDATEENEADAL